MKTSCFAFSPPEAGADVSSSPVAVLSPGTSQNLFTLVFLFGVVGSSVQTETRAWLTLSAAVYSCENIRRIRPQLKYRVRFQLNASTSNKSWHFVFVDYGERAKKKKKIRSDLQKCASAKKKNKVNAVINKPWMCPEPCCCFWSRLLICGQFPETLFRLLYHILMLFWMNSSAHH